MSSYKYVCFDCRTSYRRDPNSKSEVICSECGKGCYCIGVKIPIPPKNKVKAWVALREQLNHELRDWADKRHKENVATKHALEKEINKLSMLPTNSGRSSMIKQLKSRLKQLNA